MPARPMVTAAVMLAANALALLAPPAHGQQQLKRVEITGSAIKRVEATGPVPVDVYTRREIERTGATTISELVKNLSVFDIDDQGELTNNSPEASGASSLQIRGLSERNVLVLLNGRRLPVNALTDVNEGGAVDVNLIPLSAIERIEILKDGGSAIYGADAVAGVINFITRRNYTGAEARAGYGISSRGDAKETSAGVIAGFGDYEGQGFNLLAVLDRFKRDPLLRADRAITSSANWTRFDGGNGADGRSVFHPVGNIIDPTLGQVRPCPAEDLPLDPDGLCLFDFNRTLLPSINGADRWSAMLIGSLNVGIGRAFAEATYSRSEDEFAGHPAPGFVVDAMGRTLLARFTQAGPRISDRKASLTQLVAGMEGSAGPIDWDFAVGEGTSRVTNNDTNWIATDRFLAAVANGTIDPTSDANPQAAVDALRLLPTRRGKSVLRFVNTKVTGQLAPLPGGSLAYAVGVQFDRESLSDRPDADQQAGNVFGSIAQGAVDASRKHAAMFGELSIPFLKSIESQVALRYDRYSGDTSRTSPKVALKYQPVNAFALRGSYSESFLVPSLKQLYGGQSQGGETTDDPTICGAFPGHPLAASCTGFPYLLVGGSNPNLEPETGKTYGLGFIVEPVPQLALGLDLFRINKRDEIGVLTAEAAAARGNVATTPLGEAQVFVLNQNIAQTKVEGLDLDLRLSVGETLLGRMRVRNAFTYYTKNRKQFEPGGPFFEFNATFLLPRWRNAIQVNFENGPWSTTFLGRTTSGMRDSDQPSGSVENANARKIDAYDEIDVTVQYTGISALTLAGGVKNLFDRMPPYSNEATQGQYGSLGFPWIYSPRGRFFFVSASYAFR